MRRSEALHSSLCGVDVGAQLDSLLLQQPPIPPRTRAPSPITPVPPSAPSVSSPKGRWVNQKWWVSSVWEKTLNPKGSHLPTCACVSQHEFKLQPCLEHAVRELCQGVKRVRGKGRERRRVGSRVCGCFSLGAPRPPRPPATRRAPSTRGSCCSTSIACRG